jgi:hypothetical protein
MRFLTPLLLSGMFLFSWGTASAQAPVIDGYADGQDLDMFVLRDVRAAMDRAQMPLMTDPAPVLLVPRIVRLRTVGSSLAAIVTDATVRSATFRHLAHAISQTDGIVYVEDGDCGHGVRACLAAVTTAGANRIVRVRVDANTADWHLMGSIGHELQHAVEVLSSPIVTNTNALYLFYQRNGIRTGSVFETAAAVRAGNEVRAEVRRSNALLTLTRPEMMLIAPDGANGAGTRGPQVPRRAWRPAPAGP